MSLSQSSEINLTDNGKLALNAKSLANSARSAAENAYDLANGAQRTADGKNSVYRGTNPNTVPTSNLKAGDLYFTDNALYTWTGSTWEKTVSDTTGEEIHTKVEEAMQESQKSVADLKAEVESKVSEIDSNLSANTTDLTNVKTDLENTKKNLATTADDLKSSLSAVSDNLSATKTDLENTKTSLSTTVENLQKQTGQLSGSLETANSMIMFNSNAISEVKHTAEEISTTVSNIRVGGRNLLTNTRTLSDVWNGATETVDGFTVAKATQTNDGNYDPFAWYWLTNIKSNTDYVLTFYAKASKQTRIYSYLYNIGTDTVYADGSTPNTLTTDYQRYIVHFHTMALPAGRQVNCLPVRLTENGVTAWIYGVQLEEGNTATQWQPNPDDTDQAISKVSQAADAIRADLANTKGDVASVKAKADSLTSQIVDANGKISAVEQKADSIGSTVADWGTNLYTSTSDMLQSITFTNWEIFYNFKAEMKGQAVTTKVWIEKPTQDVLVEAYSNKSDGHWHSNTIKAGESGYASLTFTVPTDDWNDTHVSFLAVSGGETTLQYKDLRIMYGEISTLKQTASDLTSKVADTQGNVSGLQQTASKLQSDLTNAKDDISSLQQTASGLTSRVGNAESNISQLQQTADSLTTTVGKMPEQWQQAINDKTSAQVLYSNVDMNNLTTAGTYLIKDFGVKNSPISAWFMATVEATADHLRVVQRVKKDDANVAYERSSKDDSWTDWERIATGTDVSSIKQTMDGITTRVTNTEGNVSTLQQTANSLNAYVRGSKGSKTLESILSMDPDNSTIAQVVDGQVVAAINTSSDGSVKIDGKTLHITADTRIENAVIKSAMIDSIDASKITTGTLDASHIKVINLDANSITTGSLSAALYSVTDFTDYSVSASKPWDFDYTKLAYGNWFLNGETTADHVYNGPKDVYGNKLTPYMYVTSRGSADGTRFTVTVWKDNDPTQYQRVWNGSSWSDWVMLPNSQNLVSAINLSPDGVKISGKNIELNGDTTIHGQLNLLPTDQRYVDQRVQGFHNPWTWQDANVYAGSGGLQLQSTIVSQSYSNDNTSIGGLIGGSSAAITTLAPTYLKFTVYPSWNDVNNNFTNQLARTYIDAGRIETPDIFAGNFRLNGSKMQSQDDNSLYVTNSNGTNFEGNGKSVGFQVWGGIGLGQSTIYTPTTDLYVQQGNVGPALGQSYSSANKTTIHAQNLISQVANSVASRLSIKTDITPVSYDRALAAVEGTEMYDYRYISDDSGQHYVSGIIDDVNPENPQYHMDGMLINKERTARIDANLVGYHHVIIQKLLERVATLEAKLNDK